jgi:hypothetical protein
MAWINRLFFNSLLIMRFAQPSSIKEVGPHPRAYPQQA